MGKLNNNNSSSTKEKSEKKDIQSEIDEDKFKPLTNRNVSLRDFGGIGDGVSDDTEAFQKAMVFLKKQKFPDKLPPEAYLPVSRIKDFITLDLSGGNYLISKPIKLNFIYGCIIANGAITASADFPIDEYLFDCESVNTTKIENILFECRKRANGIFAHKFFRLRVEDCTILHQKYYGIHGSRIGYNHELEVFKCNITEYLWGDGKKQPKHNSATEHLPDFKEASNRESIGVFLGQADNVVADCNINCCKVGIKVGMRANRIQGNHITSGGTYTNAIYDGILMDKNVKSSCLIVNNYIDNGRLTINIDDKKICKRNYVTVTDNLFYRGFNHPSEDEEFNHIYIRALTPNSVLQNIIVSDNQFYTQDENLNGEPKRIIKPIHVDVSPYKKDGKEIQPYINNNQVVGAIVSGNNFTNVNPYFVIPMATKLTGIIYMPDSPQDTFSFDFSRHIPWGEIRSYSVSMTIPPNETPVPYAVSNIKHNQITIKTATPVIARFDVTVDVNNPYNRSNNPVVLH